MFFHSVRKTVAYPKLYIDNKEIERVDSFLFLDSKSITISIGTITFAQFLLRSQRLPAYYIN